VLLLRVPPLRDRREDIPTFVEHYLAAFATDVHRQAPSIEPDALRLLQHHDWPGNVRELKNVVQRLVYEHESVITVTQAQIALGTAIRRPPDGDGYLVRVDPDEPFPPWRQMERTVREQYFRYVRAHSSSDADAAKKLGLAPPNYHRMCKELGLK
jgi:DNA-binding NtrC family response regulator